MRGNQYGWTVGKLENKVSTSGVQTLVVKSDQEASIVDEKSSMMVELRSGGGSICVS